MAGVKLKPKSKSSRLDENANSNPAGDQLDRAVGVQPIRTKQTLCEKEIVMLRKKIGRLTNYCKDPTKRKARRVRFIIKDGDARATLQDLKMKLAAKSKKLRTENTKRVRFRNNKLFYENQKAFYSQLRGECTQTVTDPPQKEDLQKLWNGIWGDDKPHNVNAGWIEAEKKEIKRLKVNSGEISQ